MNLAIEVRTVGSTAVVACSGSLVLGERIDVLRTTLYELLYRYDRVTLDIANLDRLDGAGLGVIAGAAAMTVISGRSLGVTGARGVIDQTLTVTRLNTAVETYGGARRCAAA